MDYLQFAYPKYEVPLLQAYDGRFEAAFIALHPFFRMPADVCWKARSTEYPDDHLIRQYGQPVYWQTVMEAINCNDLRRFYIGMRTSIGAWNEEYKDSEIAGRISEYNDQCNIYYPTEGRIEPLLVESMARYLCLEKADKILYLAEFEKEPDELSAKEVIYKCDERFMRGSLFNSSLTRLATVDWDDFFTVIYGSAQELSLFLKNNPLEGFFCDNETLHTWCWQKRSIKPAV